MAGGGPAQSSGKGRQPAEGRARSAPGRKAGPVRSRVELVAEGGEGQELPLGWGWEPRRERERESATEGWPRPGGRRRGERGKGEHSAPSAADRASAQSPLSCGNCCISVLTTRWPGQPAPTPIPPASWTYSALGGAGDPSRRASALAFRVLILINTQRFGNQVHVPELTSPSEQQCS